jgi:cytochrome c oxidase subunit 4
MADEPAATGTATEEQPGAASAEEQPGTALATTDDVAAPAPAAAPLPMLPGEVRPHPTPQRYVVIAAVLVVVTSAEIGLYYLQGNVANGLIIVFLLLSMLIKFSLVASWYMHLKTDRPVFRRFFVLGIVAAISLYLIVLTMLHVFSR